MTRDTSAAPPSPTRQQATVQPDRADRTRARAQTLGADLRALRRSRGRTLNDLAGQLGRSVGWLSQVERDLSEPSVSDLKQIAACLGVPVSMLFGQASAPAGEQGYIVRADARRPMGGALCTEGDGLREELLSPDLTDDFEMLHSTFLPGARSQAPQQRPTQEVGYVVSGTLDLRIAGRAFRVGAGDSFRIRGEAFEWANPGDTPCAVVWVIAPPIY